MTKEAQDKFGSLYQFGVDFMVDFNDDADTFLTAYEQYKDSIIQNGYSKGWEVWKEDNQDLIIRLYNALDEQKLIPVSPIVNG